MEGFLGNTVEEFKEESSAYKCIEFDNMDKRSLIKMRKSVGDKTQPCGTDPSAITEKDLFES